MNTPTPKDEKPRQEPPRTVKQHVLPLASIKRFYGPRNNVEVDLFAVEDPFTINGKNKNFVALRAWTQFSEDATRGYEDDFQNAVDELLQHKSINERHMKVFSRFYALIRARSKARYTPVPSGFMMTDISPAPELSEDQILLNERQGIFHYSDEENLNRMVKDYDIFLSILATERRQDHWGLLVSTGPEFLVSDDFYQFAQIPVTPYAYLVWETKTRFLSEFEVHQMNRRIKASARNFCFARSLDACWQLETPRTAFAPRSGASGV